MKRTSVLTKIVRSTFLVVLWTYALANHATWIGYTAAASAAVLLVAAVAIPVLSRASKGTWGITAASVGSFVGVAIVLLLGAPTACALFVSALDAYLWSTNTLTLRFLWVQVAAIAVLGLSLVYHLVGSVLALRELKTERNSSSPEYPLAKLAVLVVKDFLVRAGSAASGVLAAYSWVSASFNHAQALQKILWVAAVYGGLLAVAGSIGHYLFTKKFHPLQLGLPLAGTFGTAFIVGTFYSLGVTVIDALTFVASKPAMMYGALWIAGGTASVLVLGGSIVLMRRYGNLARTSDGGQRREASERSREVVLDRWAKASLLTTTLPTINYLWTHSLDDFFVVAQRAAIIAAILSVIVTALAYIFRTKKPGPLWFLVSFLVVPGLFGVSSFGVYALYVSVLDLFSWVQPKSLSTAAMLFRGAAIALTLGAFFFYVRLRLRCIYGLTEVAAGMLIAADRVREQSMAMTPVESNFYFAVLTAGIYLVVRGLDNIHQGLTKEPRDPLARALVNYLALKEDEKSDKASPPDKPSAAPPTPAITSDRAQE